MTSVEINQISIRTVDQGDNESGEWVLQRRGRVTASLFGDIVKRKAAYIPLVERLLYSKTRRTKAMQYGHNNEPKARDMYCEYLNKFRHKNATVEKTGFYIDYQVHHCTHKMLHLTKVSTCSLTGWVHHQMVW